MNKPTVFIGPIPPPITGLAISVEHIYENYKGEKYLININYTNKSTFLKLITLCNAVFKLVLLLFIRPTLSRAYFTSSLTKEGVIRDIIFIKILSFFNITIINHLYGAGLKDMLTSLPKWLFNLAIKAYKRIDTSIILMDEMKIEFDYFSNNMRIEVVPLFYDTILDTVPDSKKVNTTALNISFYSNLLYSKGIICALEAFETISKKYPTVNLHIAGVFMDDNYKSKEEVKKLFDDYQTKNYKIYYHGIVKSEKKVNFLFDSDILVFPSFYPKEAFPISIIEAMRCGNAIITTKHNYLHHIINSKQGIIIEKKSVNSLVQALEIFIRDKNLLKETQLYNLNFAKNTFSLDLFLERVYSIINRETN